MNRGVHINIPAIAFCVCLMSVCIAGLGQTSSASTTQKKNDEERSGYPSSLSLADAVQQFNRRAQQDRIGTKQHPLTSEEVVAAIRAWNIKDEPMDKSAYETFQAIARTGVMPKGSYIRSISGLVARNGFDIDVWWIDVQVGLDKYPTDLADVPMYAHRIRSTFVSSKVYRGPIK
jgi:hypothetical protein